MSWNVFDPAPPGIINMPAEAERRQREHDARAEQLRAALAHPAGQHWLAAELAREEAQPSYTPGRSFDETAYREGRRAVLREIQMRLARILNPES